MNPAAAARHDRANGGAPLIVRPLVGGTRPDDVRRLAEAVREVVLSSSPTGTVLLPHPPEVSADEALAWLPGRTPAVSGETTSAGVAVASGGARSAAVPGEDARSTAVPDGTATLLRTSGSTSGQGRLVALTAAALTASARATEHRLGGPGRWLLPLPAHHVAGFQVLVRAALAGHDPVVLDTTAGFDPIALGRRLEQLGHRDERWYTSFVPTQLVRVLDAGERAIAPLRRFAAILVGGAALAPRTRERAREEGLSVVRTYGMTETGGGCVYDGVPLPGVEVAIEEGSDRVLITGPVLAAGHVGGSEDFVVRDGRRWLRTADRGRLLGRRKELQVLGRADEVINTGGVKVPPTEVEAALAPAVGEVVVVGVPDPEWGELVTAVVARTEAPSLTHLRRVVQQTLPGSHAPRALAVVHTLPTRGPGKVDRRAAAELAAQLLADGTLAEVYRGGR